MIYRVLKYWGILGKNRMVFFTNRMEESLDPLVKRFSNSAAHQEKNYHQQTVP